MTRKYDYFTGVTSWKNTSDRFAVILDCNTATWGSNSGAQVLLNGVTISNQLPSAGIFEERLQNIPPTPPSTTITLGDGTFLSYPPIVTAFKRVLVPPNATFSGPASMGFQGVLCESLDDAVALL